MQAAILLFVEFVVKIKRKYTLAESLRKSLYAIVNGSCAFRHVRPPYLFQAPEISFNINIGHMNI